MAKAISVKSLIKDTSTKTGIDQRSVETITNSLIKEIIMRVNKGEEVRIKGLGVFKLRPSKERRFRRLQSSSKRSRWAAASEHKFEYSGEVEFEPSAKVKAPEKLTPLDYGPIRFMLVHPPSYKEIVEKARSYGLDTSSDQNLHGKR
jgi:nucleoid DNA-binding protein